MSLAIRPLPRVTEGSRRKQPTPTAETRLERLVKLLPADVFAMYIPAVGLGTITDWHYYPLVLLIFATALVPLLLYLDARSTGEPVPSMQYAMRTATFLAWAFLISPSISPVAPPTAAIAAIALPLAGEYLVRVQQRPW
jgi:hypothetical protein